MHVCGDGIEAKNLILSSFHDAARQGQWRENWEVLEWKITFNASETFVAGTLTASDWNVIDAAQCQHKEPTLIRGFQLLRYAHVERIEDSDFSVNRGRNAFKFKACRARRRHQAQPPSKSIVQIVGLIPMGAVDTLSSIFQTNLVN